MRCAILSLENVEERVRYVETMQTVKRQDSSYTINDAVGALFSKN